MSRQSSNLVRRNDDRQGLHTVLSNGSNAAGQEERIAVFTMLLPDANLFYALGVAPRDNFAQYEGVFRKVIASIQITR